MYRIAIEKLLKWKQSKRRKPLIIEGARQVGKPGVVTLIAPVSLIVSLLTVRM